VRHHASPAPFAGGKLVDTQHRPSPGASPLNEGTEAKIVAPEKDRDVGGPVQVRDGRAEATGVRSTAMSDI